MHNKKRLHKGKVPSMSLPSLKLNTLQYCTVIQRHRFFHRAAHQLGSLAQPKMPPTPTRPAPPLRNTVCPFNSLPKLKPHWLSLLTPLQIGLQISLFSQNHRTWLKAMRRMTLDVLHLTSSNTLVELLAFV